MVSVFFIIALFQIEGVDLNIFSFPTRSMTREMESGADSSLVVEMDLVVGFSAETKTGEELKIQDTGEDLEIQETGEGSSEGGDEKIGENGLDWSFKDLRELVLTHLGNIIKVLMDGVA